MPFLMNHLYFARLSESTRGSPLYTAQRAHQGRCKLTLRGPKNYYKVNDGGLSPQPWWRIVISYWAGIPILLHRGQEWWGKRYMVDHRVIYMAIDRVNHTVILGQEMSRTSPVRPLTASCFTPYQIDILPVCQIAVCSWSLLLASTLPPTLPAKSFHAGWFQGRSPEQYVDTCSLTTPACYAPSPVVQ